MAETPRSDALRIDRPVHAVRVWERGTHKLWLRVDDSDSGAATAVELPSSLELPVGESRDAIRLTGPLAATARFWRHRLPRPDALAMRLRLRPHAGATVLLRAPVLDDAPHRPLLRCLADGFTAACLGIGCFPVIGYEILVEDFVDDGPSSAEGVRLAAEQAGAALLVECYRRGVLPYL